MLDSSISCRNMKCLLLGISITSRMIQKAALVTNYKVVIFLHLQNNSSYAKLLTQSAFQNLRDLEGNCLFHCFKTFINWPCMSLVSYSCVVESTPNAQNRKKYQKYFITTLEWTVSQKVTHNLSCRKAHAGKC